MTLERNQQVYDLAGSGGARVEVWRANRRERFSARLVFADGSEIVNNWAFITHGGAVIWAERKVAEKARCTLGGEG